MPAKTNVLIFTYIGYEVSEINVSGNNNLDVAMKLQTTNLNEVIVTGYSAQRKKDITGSVAVVNVNNVKQIPTGSISQALQGQASGVTVLTSGTPGGGTQIRVRGITSISNTAPLVIVDGTPTSITNINVNDVESIQVLKDAGAGAIYGVRGSNGVIVITTKRGRGKVRVAYDGYYGTQIPFKNGFNMANAQETANAIQQSYLNDLLTPAHKQLGTGTTPILPDYITPTATMNGGPNTDPSTYAFYTNQITRTNKAGTIWFDEIFDPAPIQSHSVSVSSGNDRSAYFLSLNYFNQQGTLLNTYLKRYSARINTTFNVANRVRVGENAYVFYRQAPGFNNQNEGNAISYSYRESALIPVYDIVGNFAGTGSQGLGNSQNPYANLVRTKDNKGNNWQVIGNVFAEADILKNLTIRTQFGGTIDNYYNNFFSFTQYENQENNRNPNAFTEQFGYNSSYTWTNTVQYTHVIRDDHNIKVLVGSEAIKNYGRAIQGVRNNYFISDPRSLTVDPTLWTLSFGPPSGQTTGNINGTPYENRLYSLFGRLDYSYRDKYLLSGTLRRDGSSVFAPDQRYGTFPSATAGWRISREKFMEGVSWLNELKLRAGWGKLGSLSNVNATNAYTLYNQSAANSYYDINGINNGSVVGVYASQLGNANTTWEEDIVTNVGFDASILKNKLDFSIEWYKKQISGLLFRPAAPPVIQGPTQPFVNAGDIQNTGIDASVTYRGTITKDLTFDVTATFTSYNNKVKSLPPGIKYYDQNSAGSGRLGAFSRLQPDHPIGAFFGYEVVGFFMDAKDIANSAKQEEAAPGRLKYKDVNGDGVINVNDRTFFGDPNPDFTSGINIALAYKNFDFSTFLYASVGNDVLNYVRYWVDFPQVFDGAISKDAALNSVILVDGQGKPTTVLIKDPADPTGNKKIINPDAHVSNPGAKVPVLERSSNFSTTQQFNSYYLENGSFLKMKSLILGYTIPAQKLSRFGIERLRVYFQAANLFTATKYTGIDPELTGADQNNNTTFGIDLGNYPANQKSYLFGVNLNF
jgi:TonB-linked SusC/RagA family outer membrane protein